MFRVRHAFPAPEIGRVCRERVRALNLCNKRIPNTRTRAPCDHISSAPCRSSVFKSIPRCPLRNIRTYRKPKINHPGFRHPHTGLNSSCARLAREFKVCDREIGRCANSISNNRSCRLHSIRMTLRSRINGTDAGRINLCSINRISCRFHSNRRSILVHIRN